ncbi:hypothetical protein CRG98_027953 [Punica granatum]|uniref:Response regulatory domain-containing protein n=1 Tax=Punica granatum TaxID=22663 RepID=A0A2I0J5Y1_PUNGR|nr:hypothetical protein CRG98_027953 [Punica granatum]
MDVDIMKRGVEKGACDFLIKLIRDDTLKMIWTSVFRSRLRNEGVIVNNDVISEVNQQERLDSPIQSTSDDSAMHGRSEGSSGMNRGRGATDFYLLVSREKLLNSSNERVKFPLAHPKAPQLWTMHSRYSARNRPTKVRLHHEQSLRHQTTLDFPSRRHRYLIWPTREEDAATRYTSSIFAALQIPVHCRPSPSNSLPSSIWLGICQTFCGTILRQIACALEQSQSACKVVSCPLEHPS